MSSKQKYEASFKAQLAIESLDSKKSILELSAEKKVPQTNLHEWRSKLISNAHELFLGESEKNKKLKALEQEISNLHKVIGEITVENNFYKKKLKN